MRRHAALPVLFERVHSRSRELQASHPLWPCGRGCDACCRRLSRVPELTRSEWELMHAALGVLPEAAREACFARARSLAEQVQRPGERGPFACPFLDESQGACRVYAARPVACRTYGFYASHHHDAWCERVAEHVSPVRERLVFGNQDAVERDLSLIDSDRRGLLTWLAAAAHAT